MSISERKVQYAIEHDVYSFSLSVDEQNLVKEGKRARHDQDVTRKDYKISKKSKETDQSSEKRISNSDNESDSEDNDSNSFVDYAVDD